MICCENASSENLENAIFIYVRSVVMFYIRLMYVD